MSVELELQIGGRSFGRRERTLIESELLMGVPEYVAFATENSGADFGAGIYRVHNAESSSRIVSSVREYFSSRPGHIEVFAFDWLGRQYAVDGITRVASGFEVLQLDPATGQVLRTGCDIATFHDTELASYADEDLAIEYYRSWVSSRLDAHKGVQPLGWDECVGFRVPLLLGGHDKLENLEVTDVVVYWDLMAQLYAATRDLPPNSSVKTVAIE